MSCLSFTNIENDLFVMLLFKITEKFKSLV